MGRRNEVGIQSHHEVPFGDDRIYLLGQNMKRPAACVLWVGVMVLCLTVEALGQTEDEVLYYHTDGIGSVRLLTDANGQIVAQYDYLPFGEPWGQSSVADPRRFTGMERDSETGLHYVGARYYASQTGRFTSTDPLLEVDKALVDPQRWNRYVYVRNNPLRYVDPDGRAIETVWDVISLGMSAKAVWQDPGSIWTWVSLGADVVSVVGPGIPAVGMAIRGVNKADSMIDAIRTAREASGATRGANRAYEMALSGGDHFGTVRNYIGRSPNEILGAMRSHEGTVAEHVRKLADPAKFAKNWDRMTERERAGLINKWQKDLQRNQDLANIMRGLYEDLGYGLMR